MNTYEFTVKLQVSVDAYDLNDAKELLEDAFGLGEDCGVTIEKVEFRESV